MCTHYILIDYENIQPRSLNGLDPEKSRVLVFVGASQARLSYDIAVALQKFGSRAEYIKIAGHGANALDFHIAFHVGRLSVEDPTAVFHIVSKDTGFDPLLEHLRARKIRVFRCRQIPELASVPPESPQPDSDYFAAVVANLRQRGNSRPRTLKTLTSTIRALFPQKITEEEILAVLEQMQARGYITVRDTKVAYALPGKP